MSEDAKDAAAKPEGDKPDDAKPAAKPDAAKPADKPDDAKAAPAKKDAPAGGAATMVMGAGDAANALDAAQAIAKLNARLVIGHAEHRGEHKISGREVKVGREGANHINVGHASISATHATIRWAGDGFEIVDHGSSNGTRVEDNPVPPEQGRKLTSHTAVTLGAVPCLYIVDPQPGEQDADAGQVTNYLVQKGWISKYQAQDAIKDHGGKTSSIAAAFVGKGVCSAEQWAEAFKGASMLATQGAKVGGGGGGGGGGKIGCIIAVLFALVCFLSIAGVGALYFLKPELFDF